VPLDAVVANVNLDMPVFLYPLQNVMTFGSEYSTLEGTVAGAISGDGLTITPDPIPEANVFFRSDQYAFARAGIPVAYITTGFESFDPELRAQEIFMTYTNEHSHMPSDELSLGFDVESARRFLRAAFLVGLALAEEEGRPSWRKDGSLGQVFAERLSLRRRESTP
jgi:Zn-dependent M28 family amino/carboxypeptidase